MSFIARAVAVVLLLIFTTTATAATQAEIDQARSKGLAWLITHQNGDGSWQAAPGLEVQSTSAALDALMNAGIYRGYSFGSAVAWLQNANAPSVDSLSRKISTLADAGTSVQTELVRLLAMKNWQSSATWGAYGGYDTSFPDTPLAQSAIRVASYRYPSVVNSIYPNQRLDLNKSVYCDILHSQQITGSWTYTVSSSSWPSMLAAAIIPTAIYNP